MKAEAKQKLTTCLIIALGIVILALGVRLTTAAFTANDFLKAVSTTGKTQELFTSDLLDSYPSNPSNETLNTNRQSIALSGTSETASFSFGVYNYLQNKANVNTKDITYNLTIRVEGVSDFSDYSVTWSNGDSSQSLSFSSDSATFNNLFLQGYKASEHRFTVTFPTSDLGHVSFMIYAIPVDGEGMNLNCLAKKVVPNQASAVVGSSVSGVLEMSGALNDNAAFNYRITVTGRANVVQLEWPANAVVLEPFFAENYFADENRSKPQPLYSADGATGQVTIYLKPGTHTVNFYRKAGAEITDETNFKNRFVVSTLAVASNNS